MDTRLSSSGSSWALIRFLDLFIPEPLRSDPDATRRARIIIGTSLVFGLAAAAGVPVRLSSAPFNGWTVLGMAFCSSFFVVPLVVKWTGETYVTGLVTTICCLAALLVAAYLEGGLQSPLLIVLPFLPLLAGLMVSARVGWVIALVVVAFCLGGVLLHRSGELVPVSLLSPAQEIPLRAFGMALMALMVAGVVFFHERVRIASEQRLLAARLEAERASQAKSLFLANMSHEVRTPMAGILGLADLLLEADLTEEAASQVRTIVSSAESLRRVLDDILDFSKIEAGELVFEEVEFSLREVMAEVLDLLRPVGLAKKVVLRDDVDEELPDFFRGDPTRIRQVLLNLVGNGIKFTEEGNVDLQARPWRDGDGASGVSFVVRDTGVGMRSEDSGRLFSPFQQADASMSRRFGGTGLGLAISRELAELMGGTIKVHSQAGIGSTFIFTARLEPLAKHTSEQDASAIRRRRSMDGTGYRLLLAEDNLVTALVARKQLELLGFEVDVVTDGVQVLEALGERTYAAVLMDCQMPELDGYETCRLWRQRETGHLPVIAFTANALRGDREKCLAAGMDDYLTKPFRKEDLSRVLSRWI